MTCDGIEMWWDGTSFNIVPINTDTAIKFRGVKFCMPFVAQGASEVGNDVTWKWQVPHALKITEVSWSCSSVSQAINFNILEGTTSILGGTQTIQTTTQVMTPTDTSIADNAILTIKLDATNSSGTVTDFCCVIQENMPKKGWWVGNEQYKFI